MCITTASLHGRLKIYSGRQKVYFIRKTYQNIRKKCPTKPKRCMWLHLIIEWVFVLDIKIWVTRSNYTVVLFFNTKFYGYRIMAVYFICRRSDLVDELQVFYISTLKIWGLLLNAQNCEQILSIFIYGLYFLHQFVECIKCEVPKFIRNML